MGVYVVVADYYQTSPAKEIADEAVLISATDVDKIVEYCRLNDIEGVTTGFIDILLEPCYVLIVFAVGYVMNAEQIGLSMKKTGLVTADAMSVAFNSRYMSKVLIIDGLCGIITSWNSFLIGGSRALYSMATSCMLLRRFAQLHKKYNTPINGKRSITCTLIFKRSFFYDLFLMFAGRLGDHGRRYSRNERSVSSMCSGISVSRYSKYSYGFKLLAFAVSAML